MRGADLQNTTGPAVSETDFDIIYASLASVLDIAEGVSKKAAAIKNVPRLGTPPVEPKPIASDASGKLQDRIAYIKAVLLDAHESLEAFI